VFLTRGEGGQNEKGPELYEHLGVLRTAETEAAGKIQGTAVFFLNFMDFGYSKSATESFRKWGRDEVQRRLVYVVRKLKPDVIFSNMNTIEGHGHHQAAVIAAIAAFDAAADSTFAPEQLRLPGISLWQPKKLFIRNVNRPDIGMGNWGPNDVVDNILETDTVREVSYLEIAANALRMHKTQGLERADLRRFTRGQSLYRLIRANNLYQRDTTTFFGGIDLWNDPGTKPLTSLRETLRLLREGMPLDSLLKVAAIAMQQMESVRPASPLAVRILSQWREEVERLVLLSCRIFLTFCLGDSVVVPRQRVNGVVEMRSAECAISDVKVRVDVPAGWSVSDALEVPPVLRRDQYARTFSLTVGEAPVLTLPKSVAQYRSIEVDPAVSATVHCSINGHPFAFITSAPFDVAPPQMFSVFPSIVRAVASRPVSFVIKVVNFRPGTMAGRDRAMSPRVDSRFSEIPGREGRYGGTRHCHYRSASRGEAGRVYTPIQNRVRRPGSCCERI
jgi:LmbE family N-acetylglucosaminyl deacetylase